MAKHWFTRAPKHEDGNRTTWGAVTADLILNKDDEGNIIDPTIEHWEKLEKFTEACGIRYDDFSNMLNGKRVRGKKLHVRLKKIISGLVKSKALKNRDDIDDYIKLFFRVPSAYMAPRHMELFKKEIDYLYPRF